MNKISKKLISNEKLHFNYSALLTIANINWTKYAYDEVERIIKETLPGERETTFFYNGRITAVTSLSSPHTSINIREVEPSGNLIKSTDNGTNTIKYEYYSSGLLSKITAPGDKYEINIEYDLIGNKTLLNDPNIGSVTYLYNAYGELISEKNARHQETTYQYDILGRIKKRNSPEDSFEWFYDSKGKISYITGNNKFKKEYFYDVFGRIVKYTQQTDATSEDAFEFGFDFLNRPSITVYPSGFSIRNVYNNLGFLSAVVENESNKKIWETTTINAIGQIKATKLGNGLSTTKQYNDITGFIEEITCSNIQSMKYQWFDRALLLQRDDLIHGMHETFEYDALDRLHIISNSVTSTNTTIEYDILGNITSKSDVGSYTNGGSTNKPNCVESIILNSTSALLADQIIDYSSFEKVISISEGNKRVTYQYSNENSRIEEKEFEANQVIRQKQYFGNFERITADGKTKELHYISGADGLCAIYVTETDAEPQMLYVLTDHLGSIQIITDKNGNKLEEYSYDAWGRQRDPITMAPVQTPTRGMLDLGFSGHEFIALANLVNMEGRIYDPVIGRFLSPDPFLTLPEYTQGLNRYSYVLNNPLSLTDPSGYSSVGVWLKYNWKPITSTIVAVGVTIAFPGSAGVIVPAAVGGFAGGFTYAMLTTGNLGDAFLLGLSKVPVATFSAMGSFMIGEVFTTGNNLVFGKLLLKPLVHGAFQGGLSYGNGSSFASGFYAGMFSSLSGGLTSNTETTFGRIIIGAVAGGVGAEIGGGKFANGAVTGAFVMMFNELKHLLIRPDEDGYLTIGEATFWYKQGKGVSLYVDIKKLDLSKISKTRFDNTKLSYKGRPMIQVNFAGSDFVNPTQAVVFGTISLVLMESGSVYALSDTYNFDIKGTPESIKRDMLTVAAKEVSGYGQSFKIWIYGTVTLNK